MKDLPICTVLTKQSGARMLIDFIVYDGYDQMLNLYSIYRLHVHICKLTFFTVLGDLFASLYHICFKHLDR